MLPVIDTHFHIFVANEALPNARYKPAYDARLSDWQSYGSNLGIERGVVVQTSFKGTDNRLILEGASKEPNLLRAVVCLDPTGDRSLDEALLHELHAQHVRGIRLNLAGEKHINWAIQSDWQQRINLWELAAQQGWHIELHHDAGALPQVLRQLPGHLPLVIDHFGKPQSASVTDASIQAVLGHAKHAAVRIKISAPYRLSTGLSDQVGALAKVLLNELGDGALMWGSDWPCTNFEEHCNLGAQLREAMSWFDESLHGKIFFENAKNWYWGEAF
jgi:predicted TIM-barrel fold metal-dependent hydrolase